MSESSHAHHPAHSRCGPLNNNWRGGRVIASNGYVLVRKPGHHLADVRGYVYEHRLVAEEKLGRPLLPEEQIHHINGNKQNNHPENLYVAPTALHHHMQHRTAGKRLRNPGEPNREILCACGCGMRLLEFDASGRPRRFISGHNSERGYRPRQDNPLIACACGCGTQFRKYSDDGYPRQSARGHRPRRRVAPNPLVTCACGCGATFPQFDALGRPRRFVSGHNSWKKRSA